MTTKEHYATNIKLAVPVMIGQLGHVMVGVADSMMVGALGTLPLAGVALANSIFSIFMVFGLGVTFGITPLVANADGMRKTHLQGKLLHHGFYVYLCISVLLFLSLLAVIPLLPYFGQDPQLIPITTPYYIVLSSSIIPLMMFMTFKQFAEGYSDTKSAMIISVGCNILNVILNYLLIFGHFGFPKLGLIGAGWATLISRMLMFLVMWVYVRRKRKLQFISLLQFHFSKVVVKKLLAIGLPSGLQYIFEVSAFSTAAIFAGLISAQALAAHQIAINLASISYMAATGLGAAAAVRIGNQLGRRDPKNLRMAARSIFTMTVVWMSFTGLILLFFRQTLTGFYADDPEVLALAGSMVIVAVFFQLSDGLQAVGLGALRGFTDVKIPTLITFVAYWIITLPTAYFLSQYTALGAMGIWYALAGGLTISAILLMTRFWKMAGRL
ncbi:MAG: MATE family efflux transporter [Cryomorphaceae bacterium]|nr:MATE family efflux transporter [Cryomorphaceae bacterium]